MRRSSDESRTPSQAFQAMPIIIASIKILTALRVEEEIDNVFCTAFFQERAFFLLGCRLLFLFLVVEGFADPEDSWPRFLDAFPFLGAMV